MAGLSFVQGLMDDTTREVGVSWRDRSNDARQLAQDVGTGFARTQDGFKNYILSQGAGALDMGLNELRELGVSDQQLAMFKTIDPTNREQLGQALTLMGNLKLSREAEMGGQELYKKRTQKAKELAEQYINEIEGEKTEEAIAQAINRSEAEARRLVDAEARGGEMSHLENYLKRLPEGVNGERPLNRSEQVTYRNAIALINKDNEIANNVEVTFESLQEIQNGPSPLNSIEMASVFSLNDQMEGTRVIDNMTKLFNQNLDKKADKGFIDTLTSYVNEWTNGVTTKIEELFYYDDEKKKSAQKTFGILGSLLAQYIKSISGLAVTDQERKYLEGVLGIGGAVNSEVVASNLNRLANVINKNRRDNFSTARATLRFLPSYVVETFDKDPDVQKVGELIPLLPTDIWSKHDKKGETMPPPKKVPPPPKKVLPPPKKVLPPQNTGGGTKNTGGTKKIGNMEVVTDPNVLLRGL